MKALRCWALLMLLLSAGPAIAQMPGPDDIAAAVRAVEPQARAAGLALQPGVLWWSALRARSPLVAAYSRGACQLGFVPYTPGRDYRWLFPALPPLQRAAWLAGLVQHEIAHCAEQAAEQAQRQADAPAAAHTDTHTGGLAAAQAARDSGPAGADTLVAGASGADALVAGGRGTRWHEVLADLAFALQVDQPMSESGAQQVGLMASLRAEHARQDPAHDSSSELRCYLQQRLHFKPDGAWLQRLQAWRQHCWSGPAAR